MLRQRPKKGAAYKTPNQNHERYEPPPGTWNDNLPYGGKVLLATPTEPDPWWVTAIEALVVIGLVLFCAYSYYRFDHVICCINQVYAHFGHAEAQHQLGQRYLLGASVDKDHREAAKWFQKAAQSGHAAASYNLAIASKNGYAELEKGHSHRLIKYATKNGIPEAARYLEHMCQNDVCG